MSRSRPFTVMGLAVLLLVACMPQANLTGATADATFARQLWGALTDAQLVGPDAIQTKPYPGRHPHGAVLELIRGRLPVAGHIGDVIVLHNYNGAEASIASVAQQPHRFMTAISVMYRRPGHAPAARDWFWVQYRPYGRLAQDAQGRPLAGQVSVCSGCHRHAPGGDYVFSPE